MRLLDSKGVHAVFEQLHAANPQPQGELHWRNTFTLLVAVLLSAQATDKSVNKATAALFDVADTPQAMLALGKNGYAPTYGRLIYTPRKHAESLHSVLNSSSASLPKYRATPMP